jgi:hypothetical protein
MIDRIRFFLSDVEMDQYLRLRDLVNRTEPQNQSINLLRVLLDFELELIRRGYWYHRPDSLPRVFLQHIIRVPGQREVHLNNLYHRGWRATIPGRFTRGSVIAYRQYHSLSSDFVVNPFFTAPCA